MQSLLLPAAPSGSSLPLPSSLAGRSFPIFRHFSHPPISFHHVNDISSSPPCSISSPFFLKTFGSTSAPFSSPLNSDNGVIRIPSARRIFPSAATSSAVSTPFGSSSDESEKAKFAQVSKRLEKTSRHFKRLGGVGFWGQLVCTVVSAVILSFSVVITGKITSPVIFYATAFGICAAFISVFWSFGYIRLADKLRRTAREPSKAPPRADVVKGLKNGVVLNLLGMGAAIFGMLATVGFLVAKSLTSSAVPFHQGISPGYSPVLPLDVFLVQASANTILSHFLGLVLSLELLRSVTLPPSGSIPVPQAV